MLGGLGGGGGGGGGVGELMIKSYRTRPPASCDTAGFTQIPGRIPFLQGG